MPRRGLFWADPQPAEVTEQWKSSLWVYLPYLVAGVALAIALPEDIHSRSALWRSIGDVGSRFVPAVERLARVSTMPEVLRVWSSVMWLAYPVVSIIAFARAPRLANVKMSVGWLFVGFPFAALVVGLVGVVAPFFLLDLSPGDLALDRGRDKAFLAIGVSSRLGLASLGTAIMIISSIALVWVLSIAAWYPRLIRFNVQQWLDRRNS